jgi:hypothetical protein
MNSLKGSELGQVVAFGSIGVLAIGGMIYAMKTNKKMKSETNKTDYKEETERLLKEQRQLLKEKESLSLTRQNLDDLERGNGEGVRRRTGKKHKKSRKHKKN